MRYAPRGMKLLVPPSLRVTPPQLVALYPAAPLSPSATWHLAAARHVWQAWLRGFDGRPRATADPFLLRELIIRLGLLRVSMRMEHPEEVQALRPAIDTVDRVLTTLATELAAVETVDAGVSPAERAARLATRINAQLAAWQLLFSGRPRLLCRPATLRRLVRALDRLAADLADPALDPIPEVPPNRARLAADLAGLRAELPLLEGEHLRASPAQRLYALLGAADQIEAEVDGRPSTAQRDQLDEIEQQLIEIVRLLPTGPALHGLTTLQDAIDQWEAT